VAVRAPGPAGSFAGASIEGTQPLLRFPHLNAPAAFAEAPDASNGRVRVTFSGEILIWTSIHRSIGSQRLGGPAPYQT
jgi:hypothetical protein